MFINNNLQNNNLRVLRDIGELHINPISLTYQLIVKIGDFNIAKIEPSLFINLLNTQNNLRLGELILSNKNKYSNVPILNIHYIFNFSDRILKDNYFISIVNNLKEEIYTIKNAYEYILNYELLLINRSKIKNKSSTSQSSIEEDGLGVDLDYLTNYLNNIDNTKDNNEDSN